MATLPKESKAVTIKLNGALTNAFVGAMTPNRLAAPGPTVSVKFCVEFGKTPLLAVMVIGNEPTPVAVPLRTPVLLKVTPVGRAPVSLNVGEGKPEAVTEKEPAVPAVKVVLFALVMAGGWFAVSVKVCVAFGMMPLLAVMVIR